MSDYDQGEQSAIDDERFEQRVRERIRELEQTSRRLRESEERFRLAMEATSDSLWDWDIVSDTGYFSPGYYRMLGYEPGEFPVSSQAWLERIHPDDRDRALAANVDCIENRTQNFEVEFRMRSRHGEWRWVCGRGKAAARDAAGRATRMVGTHLDITERRRMEDTLLFLAGQATAGAESFLPALARYLAGTLGVEYVFIGSLLEDGETVETAAACAHGELQGPIRYALAGTPCEQVVGRTLCSYPSDVQRRFPLDRALAEMKAESYVGMPLWDSKGSPIGLVSVIACRAMGDTRTIESLLRLVALRIASELERVQAEQALRESESRFRLLAENATDMISRHDPSGVYLYVSPACRRLAGYEPDELVGRDAASLCHPDDLPDFARALQAVDASQVEHSAVYRFRCRNGGYIWFETSWHTLRDPETGGVLEIHAASRDITRRRRAEAALKESERKYRLLFENMTAGFALHEMIYDERGAPVDYRFLEINPAFERLTGLPASKLLGQTVREVLPNTENYWLQTYGRVARTGEPVSYENYSGDTGRYYDVWAFSPARDQFAVIFTDITARKLAEEERNRLEEQLRQSQKLEAVGQLAGGVAHDFNNLLTPILGYSEMLSARVPPGDPAREGLEQIRRAAERARDLNQQLLAFSRRQMLALRPVDLREVVLNLEKMLRRTIREDVRIELSLPPELRPCNADAGQIELVLMNLAVNAQDAMPGGGVLTIALEDAQLDAAFAREYPGAPAGAAVRLTVADTGAGMDADTLAHIFEPFFTTKRLGRGTGLGLSTVYGIVQQHGGSIRVRSAPGQGAWFDIFLPATEPVSERAPEAAVACVGDGCGETILLVEDEQMVRDMTLCLLENSGYDVLVAESVEQAIQVVRGSTRPIQLLLTDVIMPGMNGRELYLKLHAIRPELRVLYMSGYASDVIAHHGVVDVDVHFIQKPFTAAALFQKIRQVLKP